MTSSRGRRAVSSVALCLVSLLALAVAWPAGGQEAAGSERFELTSGLLQNLDRVRSGWEEWQSALYSGQAERFDEATDRLLLDARSLGFRGFADVSLAASEQALEVARQGNPESARWALDAAERFDPGRPETSFRRARVEALAGNPLAATRAWLGGHARRALRADPVSLGSGAGVWLLLASLLAGGLWVAAQLAVAGPGLWRDLEGFLAGRLPLGLARVLTAVAFLWPLALPAGPAWWLLYLSVLLWHRLSVSERIVAVVLWLLVGLAPWALAGHWQQRELILSPAHRALGQLARQRLYGGLFRDVDALLRQVPGDPATLQLTADLHRKLGQWDLSRNFYLRLLEQEPENSPALIDLGAYYLSRNAFGDAVGYFEQAVAADPESVEGWYGLSLAHSASYDFNEAEQALQRAQALDEERVGRFLTEEGGDQPQLVDGGFARIPALERRLRERIAPKASTPSPWMSLLLAPVLAGLGFLVGLLRPGAPPEPPLSLTLMEGRKGRWLRTLLPGVSSAEGGYGPKSYLALWPFAALWALGPALTRLQPVPAGAGGVYLVVVVTLALLVLLAARFVLEGGEA
jgi:tetratricopeptide (TPR) repeat protein